MAEGILSQSSLESAVAGAEATKKRIGEYLVGEKLISETQLAQALGHQLAIPWASLTHVEFKPEILERIPAAVAERHCILPLYIQKKKDEEILYVAMSDPTDDAAIEEAAAHAGVPVKPLVASATDLKNAIKHCYPRGDKAPPPPLPIRIRAASYTNEVTVRPPKRDPEKKD